MITAAFVMSAIALWTIILILAVTFFLGGRIADLLTSILASLDAAAEMHGDLMRELINKLEDKDNETD